MTLKLIDRDEIAAAYLDQLAFELYPVQEEALLAWFACDQGLLVCAPTGTGKTLIAEAAMFEALRSGKRAYYTTPLIALTEQKLQELRLSAVRWGFRADDIGLVTGNRRVNPDAPILVVVAEILFNRLLHQNQFGFDHVSAIVMDEFHSFNDPERGIVWEFSLGLLPKHIRLMLLSATVGNAVEFANWMSRTHGRRLEIVQSDARKVPLTYQWVGDQLLNEQIEIMARGDEASRFTPALVFCFNRDECWSVAEQLKGKDLLLDGQQARLSDELKKYDWSKGAGPKLRQILQRGVGVHHAGILPRYKRIVEDLFQRKLLSLTVCTETLAAGINLPARSVVLPNLLKGPPDKKKLIDASSAHQMFGRAGRPQFDTRGYVFALAHEDDVKILRWKERYDQIPDDTKDPQLRKAKKDLKKKMPTRRANQKYWTEAQFEQLRTSPPAKLESRGLLPWRLLAHMLDASPEIEPIRQLVGKRLMPAKKIEAGQKTLLRMLRILWTAGYVELEPKPPLEDVSDEAEPPSPAQATSGLFSVKDKPGEQQVEPRPEPAAEVYWPVAAYPTENLQKLLLLRGVNPLYGIFLINQLGIADLPERIQAFESVLELPASVARYVGVPSYDELAPGPLARNRLDIQLLQRGLATIEQLGSGDSVSDDEQDRRNETRYDVDAPRVLTLAEKLKLLFDSDFPGVHDLYVSPVWVAGEIIEFGGDFNKYITSKRLQKQEGVLFRHLLRLVLLIGEFAQLNPVEVTREQWQGELFSLRDRLIKTCRDVDPSSVDSALQSELDSV
jgi:superfamily II DNA/RNA helicase